MKKITLSLFSLLLFLGLKAQICQEIFVSEVIFSKDSISNTYLKNYSLELYNPTDVDILLSDYSIKLTPQVGNPIFIYLTDTIHSKGTYVITKIGSSLTLTSVAKILSSALDFDNFVTIELYKEDNPIDKIGNFGLTNPDDIDIIQAMANPANYLNGLNIDLRSLENLVFRRNPMIGKGNINFDNLSFEWYIQPNNDFSDIDKHTNICKQNDVIVEFAQDFYEMNEGQSIIPAINVYNYDSTCLPVLIDVGKKSTPPFDISYPFYVDAYDVITPTHAFLEVPNIKFRIYAEEKNSDLETDEVVMYELEKTLVNGKINPAKRYVTILIHNTPNDIPDGDTNSYIPVFERPTENTPPVIYPNPTNQKLYIQDKNNKVEEIFITDMLGRVLYRTNKWVSAIDIEGYAKGQYIIFIKTEHITYTNKFIKN